MGRKSSLHWMIGILVICFAITPAAAQEAATKPFILPVAVPPGPATWLMGQLYGNTTGAYNFGSRWYRAGQGLHFGIDISMPCGTPLVAVDDGEVLFVDNLGFGSAPHNLLIKHAEAGVVTLYGHLLDRPPVFPGQMVKQGDVVAYSGDPDVVCDSRPHLHLEVRSLDYQTWYNPVDYIEADWHGLVSIGSFSNTFFQQDLDNPRRWMSLDDQPSVTLGGAMLNQYAVTWPPGGGQQPPDNPPLANTAVPLAVDAQWTARPFGFPGCCPQAWWHSTDPTRLYTIDGSPGQRASILEWLVDSGPSTLVGQAPPPLLSPDGTHQVYRVGEQAIIRRLSDGAEWSVYTGGWLPALSTDNSRLLWVEQSSIALPGETFPTVTVWVSDFNGENARQLLTQSGGSARWLDEARLLVTTPLPQNRAQTLSVYDTRDNASFVLGTWEWVRGLSISPGGKRLLYYRTWQLDPALNGVFTIETLPGAPPQQLPWFGGWRWRDADSLYYLPLSMPSLVYYYDIITGDNRPLTGAPIRIANADWSVSSDGRRIAFLNADDMTLWLLEQVR